MQKINAILAHLNIGPLSEHVVRKLAHFSEFTLEGFLLMLCLRVYTRRFVRHVSWPMLGGMATALLDETIQLYVPGRTSSVRDVWIDFGGVIAGLFVALLLLLIVRGLTSFHAMKKENRRLRAERPSCCASSAPTGSTQRMTVPKAQIGENIYDRTTGD